MNLRKNIQIRSEFIPWLETDELFLTKNETKDLAIVNARITQLEAGTAFTSKFILK